MPLRRHAWVIPEPWIMPESGKGWPVLVSDPVLAECR
jgi:hypothetical protein